MRWVKLEALDSRMAGNDGKRGLACPIFDWHYPSAQWKPENTDMNKPQSESFKEFELTGWESAHSSTNGRSRAI